MDLQLPIKGLAEYEILRDGKNTIAVTLTVVCASWETGGVFFNTGSTVPGRKDHGI